MIVLGLLGLYLGLAFGLRSYLQLRRTGSTGFRGISGAPFSAAYRRRVGRFVPGLGIGLAPPPRGSV